MTAVGRKLEIIEKIATLDAILDLHADEIGEDLTRYRNRAYRVANLCAAQSPGGAGALDKIAIAAAFHDLAIWTDHTFDYFEPSVGLARAWLANHDRMGWAAEISEMIRQHHKVTHYSGAAGPLVEAFRRSSPVALSASVSRATGSPRSMPAGPAQIFTACWSAWSLGTCGHTRSTRSPCSNSGGHRPKH